MAQAQGQSDRANDLLESAFETAAENNVEALRLERVFRASGQTSLVLRVLDARLERIDDPAATAEILCARADLLADTDRLDEALDSLLDALSKTPESERLLKACHDLAVRADALDRYVIRLSALAEEVQGSSADASASLWMRAGALAETEMSDPELAARCYGRALETGARAFRAYRAMLRVIPADDTRGRVAAIRAFVGAPEDPKGDAAVRTDALYELAAVELSDGATADDGIAHLEDALARTSAVPRWESIWIN
jgi:tetratricopeptide (TPR) repeat protein